MVVPFALVLCETRNQHEEKVQLRNHWKNHSPLDLLLSSLLAVVLVETVVVGEVQNRTVLGGSEVVLDKQMANDHSNGVLAAPSKAFLGQHVGSLDEE